MRAAGLGLILMMLASSAVPAAADPATFDRTWDVLALCPATADGAFGYTLQFSAQVKAGVFRPLWHRGQAVLPHARWHDPAGRHREIRGQGSDGRQRLHAGKGQASDPLWL